MAILERRAGPAGQVANDGAAPRCRAWAGRGRWPRLATVGLVLVAVLAACGNDDDDDPTATAVAPAVATATPPPPTVASPRSDGSPAAGESTVGDIAEQIAVAWSGVTTFRANEVTFAPDDPAAPPLILASPVASSAATPGAGTVAGEVRTIDEVVLPDRKHRRIVVGDQVVSEIVFVEGRLYVRGEFVRQYVDPALPLETWVQTDLQAVNTSTEVGQTLIGFISPVDAPLSLLPPEQLDLPAISAGQTTVDGRVCEIYRVAQTTATGERVDVTIGIAADGLPCLVETRAGGQVTLLTYVAFNEPIEIAAPAEFVVRAPGLATPAATPEPAPGG